MSEKTKVVLFIFFGIIISVSVKLFAATNCEQTFTFFGATMGEPNKVTFWIGEDISGECYGSYLIQVTISDSINHTLTTHNLNYAKWDWMNIVFDNLGKLPYKKIENEEGVWEDSFISWKISTPAPDYEMIKKIYKAGYEGFWTRRHGIEGMILPEIKGIKTKPVYYYLDGLYVDYKISAVYYFPHFKYILIFTNQPHLKSGLDTMHGFLIFKIIE